MTIQRLLIANRGEIACRIIDTARQRGIHTIALCSEADRQARHVRLADEAVCIGWAEAASSYLNQKAVLDAALNAGADAIHPGYGFLSENPDFAEAVRTAGLIFVGPPADAVRAMGLKDEAKRLMAEAGVPVVPGYDGADQSPDLLAKKAADIGFPVLIKARAGGGGKGMRKVETEEAFADLLMSAVREATAAFGDGHVIIEKYITAPRHIEVQVLSDRQGTHLHLFERDCSVQRRHQKIIEEAPAPDMPDEVRSAMTDAAVTAAQAIGYEGAGTVEFIADGSGPLRADGFWFMEMNTRLQVEHPVTEQVTGLDLVDWQLRIAAGEALSLRQHDIQLSGHAIEARVYAEDPANGFLPSPGRIDQLMFPAHEGVRIDTGVEAGDEVSGYYDPMVAKLIATGTTRNEALTRLGAALGQTCLIGLTSNLAFLARLCRHQVVRAAEMTTAFLDQHLDELTDDGPPPDAVLAVACLSQIPAEAPLSGWRQWGPGHLPLLVRSAAGLQRAGLYLHGPDKIELETEDRQIPFTVIRCADDPLSGWTLTGPDGAVELTSVCQGGAIWVSDGQNSWIFSLADSTKSDSQEQSDGVVCAVMSATISQITVKSGERVAAGDRLMVLEAMKMEQPILAPVAGQIEDIPVQTGEAVSAGQVLCRLAPDEAGET